LPSIAVIGSEGSGKTILITTLAKRFGGIHQGRPALIAKDRATAMYVERIWGYLQNQEWPPSTRQGELASLTWEFIEGNVRTDLKMVDLAGQDLRLLFSEGRVHDAASLPQQLGEIVQYVRRSDIFILLVNLADFLGESNAEKRIATEWTLRGLLDYVVSQGQGAKHYAAIVFTQVDRYRATLSKDANFDEMAAKLFPNLYNAYLAPKKCARFFVSAIGSTSTEADSTGKARRVPKVDGKSDDADLQRLMTWITGVSQRVAKDLSGRPPYAASEPKWEPERELARESARGPEWETAKEPYGEPDREFDNAGQGELPATNGVYLAARNLFEWAAMVVGFLALMAIGIVIMSWLFGQESASEKNAPAPIAFPPPPRCVAHVHKEGGVDGNFWFMTKKQAEVLVQNNGGRGVFVVTVVFVANSETVDSQTREITIARGGQSVELFEGTMSSSLDHRNVKVEAKVHLKYDLVEVR
jgi:hypothetical protein